MANYVKNATIDTLNQLIDVCLDGADGYRTAMKDASAAGIKSLLNQFSSQRTQFASELQTEVVRLGGDPERDGTARAALHRGWIDVKSAITGKNDLAILEECENGDDIARDTYEKVLQKTGAYALPSDTRQMVRKQFDQIVSNHDSIKMLRDREKQV